MSFRDFGLSADVKLSSISAPRARPIYIISAGEAEVFFKNDTGERIVLEIATRGDFFGELSMLDKGSRSTSVVTTQEIEALRLDRDRLEKFIRKHPKAGWTSSPRGAAVSASPPNGFGTAPPPTPTRNKRRQ